MKNTIYVVAMLLALSFLSCNTEDITLIENISDANFRVTEQSIDFESQRLSYDDPCLSTRLMAGQHYEAGTVTVDTDGVNLIITYRTNPDWSISATHMSIGNCEDQAIPTTGSDNPKIGRFAHGTEHVVGVNQVVYYVDKNAFNDLYCFAAHAVVTGPEGQETAWAEGLDFGGNSWAMYVEARQSDCDVTGTVSDEEEVEVDDTK
jgi:hypothetical protein